MDVGTDNDRIRRFFEDQAVTSRNEFERLMKDREQQGELTNEQIEAYLKEREYGADLTGEQIGAYLKEREQSEKLKNEQIDALLNERFSKKHSNRDAIEKTESDFYSIFSLKRNALIERFQPVVVLLGFIMIVGGSLSIWAPTVFEILIENRSATLTSLSGIVLMFIAFALGIFRPSRGTSFVDIDDKLYSSRIESVESERDELFRRVSELEYELVNNQPGSNSVSFKSNESAGSDSHKLDFTVAPGAADTKGFDNYLKSVIRSLDMSIELADNKASLLLDKGTTYLWRGILFYVSSIVVWQMATAYFKVGDYAVWGMISCSMTFLVVEFLAAWFLRQYKSFTDSSFNLVRVKSVFNRYFLSYLAIKEFSDSSQHLVDMRVQILKVLEEDVKWLDPAPHKVGDLNHMVAMFESVSGLVDKLKLSSKANGTVAS